MDRRHETDEENGAPLPPFTGQSEKHAFVPAAAVMAGLAWSLSPDTVFDFNYRFTWMGSAEINTTISNGVDPPYTSRLKTGDSFDHQLRAGIRWNVW